jgi:hypothetical protein
MERMAGMGRAIATGTFLFALLVSSAHAADPAAVVAAERAFAADARVMTWPEAFKRHAAADGVMFAPEPVNAQAHLAAMAPRSRPTPQWWPLFAGMAASGDLGFTTGPSTIDSKPLGQYFTVWTKQADGRWAWALDAAPDVDPPLMAPPSSEPGVLAAGLPSAHAWPAVQTAEGALAKAAASDAPKAYSQVLANDARIAGLSKRIAVGQRQIGEELAERATAIVFKPLGGGAARAGDLAWTYGAATWTGGRGHYVQIWRHDRAGWRIVWDQLLPAAT